MGPRIVQPRSFYVKRPKCPSVNEFMTLCSFQPINEIFFKGKETKKHAERTLVHCTGGSADAEIVEMGV